MSRLKKLAGETVIYGLGAILPKVVGFLIVGSFLTFQFNEEQYGLHSNAYAYITLLIVLFTLRMETTFFKFASDKSQDPASVFNACLTIILVSSTVLFSFFLFANKPLSEMMLGPGNVRFLMYMIGILFLDAIAAVPFAKLRNEGKAMKFSLIKIANSIVTIVVNVFCYTIMPKVSAFSGWYDPAYLLDYTFIANLAGSLVIVLLLHKELMTYRFYWDRDLFHKMFRFAWPLMVVGLAQATNQFADRIFVKVFSNSFGEAGLYTGAIRIAVVMNLFVTAFNYAVEPFFFKNANQESRESLYGSIALAFTILGVAIFLGVLYFLDILKYIIDTNFHEALYIVPVALMANLMLGIYYNVSIWYKLSGKTIYGAIIAIIGTVVFISSNVVLIPYIGKIGASYASLLCFTVMCITAYKIGQRKYPINYPVWKIVSYLVAGILLYGIVLVSGLEGIMKIGLGILLLALYLWTAYKRDLHRIFQL